MTTHAYKETYLSKAQSVLGDAFDYAINICNIPGADFVQYFTVGTISKRIENGEPAIISGKSGIELAADIIIEATDMTIKIEPQERFSRTKEYWIGWAICYFQWFTCKKFSEIFSVLSYEDLENMYYTLHEADISKFVDIVNARMEEHFPDTRLKRLRSLNNLTQLELATLSGVSLRSIQMYEQRNKNINKASVETMFQLSKALGCSIEDLIEK